MKPEEQEITVRIDIDNPMGDEPVLRGLSISGFGWIVGGDKSGQLTLLATLTNAQPSDKTDVGKVKKFWNRWKKFLFERRYGVGNWRVYDAEHDKD